MSYHVVQQGEYISMIAKKHGFSSYKTIWDHPQNAELKQKRQNPNVLFPGDRVFIPEKQEKEEPGNTENRHRFELKKEPLKLRVVLEDLYFEPIANAECQLQIDAESTTVRTDGKGKIERTIKPDAQNAFVTVKDPNTPINEVLIPVKIGHLDPVEEVSGQKARLNNLGYFAGPFEGKKDEENQAMFLSAIEEFQCDHGLLVDGKCGPVTQAKLKQVHGC